MSSRVVLLQQQQASRGTAPAPTTGHAFDFWSAETIASVSGCPLEAVTANWPRIFSALTEWGIADRDVCRAVIGTVAIETASTFAPVVEAFWLDDAWRWANLQYAPYWGRGYIQETWESGYQHMTDRLGVDFVSNPDLALDPTYAAQILAIYCVDYGVAEAARQQDWPEVRRRVQGAYAGLDRLITIVNALA